MDISDLIVKTVDFEGDQLKAAQEPESKKFYVGIKWICDGLNLSEGRRKNEIHKINTDLVLKKGGRNIVLPTEGGKQSVQCIELDFLPLWLAKISITPTMKRENPFVVQKLVDYQLKAKDVLSRAFIKDSKPVDSLQFLQGMLDQMKHQRGN